MDSGRWEQTNKQTGKKQPNGASGYLLRRTIYIPQHPHSTLSHHLGKQSLPEPESKMFCSLRSMPVIVAGHKLRAASSGSYRNGKGGSSKPNDPHSPDKDRGQGGGGRCQAFLRAILNPFSPRRRRKRKGGKKVLLSLPSPQREKGRGIFFLKKGKLPFKKFGTFLFHSGCSDADLARLRPHPPPLLWRAAVNSMAEAGWGGSGEDGRRLTV